MSTLSRWTFVVEAVWRVSVDSVWTELKMRKKRGGIFRHFAEINCKQFLSKLTSGSWVHVHVHCTVQSVTRSGTWHSQRYVTSAFLWNSCLLIRWRILLTCFWVKIIVSFPPLGPCPIARTLLHTRYTVTVVLCVSSKLSKNLSP